MLCLYLISLPMAFFLAVSIEVGVKGLWTGFALGQIIIIVLYVFLLHNTDWQAVFKLNRERKLAQENERLNQSTARAQETLTIN